MAGWTMVKTRGLGVKRRPAREVIAELLAQGHRVTAGYFTTSVRGHHEYMIFWKPRAKAPVAGSASQESAPPVG